MTPPRDLSRTFDAIWSGLTATMPPGALELGATLTPATWLGQTAITSRPGPAAVASAPSIDPRRHLATLAERLGDPAAALDRLPRLSLSLPSSPEVEAQEPAELRAISILGEGGMGRVWLAVQRSLDRDLAVKTLIGDDTNAEGLRALLAEGLITGQLDHPNIVPVHQLGRDERGLPALVMKRVAGVPWTQLLADPQHPTLARFGRGLADPLDAHVEVLLRVCDAVQFAHLRGIVHRDLKPDNVMVGSHGEVYVVDWGVATLAHPGPVTESGSAPVVGTPVFMAPEMVAGGSVDARTDVFLLGAVLHEVLTGTRRHAGVTLQEVLRQALEPQPIAYSALVPSELAALANWATAPRAQRPESAEAFRAALVAWRQHRGSTDLARAAAGRLVELDAPATRGDPVLFSRLASECRFGFSQALREWPENPGAAAGLDRCLEKMLTQAIANQDLVHARGLLGELAHPPAGLRAEVDALAQRLADRDQEAARARDQDHQRDLNVAAPQRRGVALAFAALAIGITVTLTLTRGATGMSGVPPSQLLWTSVVLVTLYATITALFGRNLFSNQINRQVVAAVGVGLGAMVFNRVLGFASERSTDQTMIIDLQLIGTVTLLAGLLVHRALLVSAALCLSAAGLATRHPTWAGMLFGVAPISSFMVIALLVGPSEGPSSAAPRR